LSDDRLFHIVAPDVWAAAVEAGEYRPPSLAAEGFVHLSYADQVQGVANARYRDEPVLQVVELDPTRITEPIRVEDSYGSGAEFPHVYGVVDPTWAVRIHPLARDRAGDWTFSAGS
jgi:uncharacterized protein (DUF952 family)